MNPRRNRLLHHEAQSLLEADRAREVYHQAQSRCSPRNKSRVQDDGHSCLT